MSQLHSNNNASSPPWKPSKLNKILTGLWCGALLRKGPMCCTTNCSCFNDVENPDAQRARAEEARWNYRSEKLADKKEAREKAAERRDKRREVKSERREAKKVKKQERSQSKNSQIQSTMQSEKTSPVDPPSTDKEQPIPSDPPSFNESMKKGITEEQIEQIQSETNPPPPADSPLVNITDNKDEVESESSKKKDKRQAVKEAKREKRKERKRSKAEKRGKNRKYSTQQSS